MTTTVDASKVPHERYTPTDRKAYHSQDQVAKAWSEGLYPTHNGGRLYSSENFKGYQYEDGSGKLMHYRTREAIRTREGLIIDNSQCWARGFAHCSPPPNSDATLPVSAIERLLDHEDDIYDIWGVGSGSSHGTGYALIDGYAVAIGRDDSATGRGLFAVKLRTKEAKRLIREDVQDVLNDVLTPDPVRESDLPVVDSSEFTKTKLEEDELEAHKSHGGNTTMINRSRWRGDYEGNLQQYRADLRGQVIVRQGEYFFIPDWTFDPNEHEDARFSKYKERTDDTPSYRSPPRLLGSHVPQRSDGLVTVGDDIWVQGSVRHENGDHDAINLGDIWHRVVTHDREALSIDTSPRGGSYVD